MLDGVIPGGVLTTVPISKRNDIMARKLPRFLTKEEVMEMFRVASGSKRDLILLKCFYYLGLRNSELQKMLIEDVDLINGVIKIVQGKGEKDRYVPMPPGFTRELKEWVGQRSGYLFQGRSGEAGLLSDRHIRRLVKKYAKLTNVRKYEEIHPHTLRHSYATHLQNRGIPLNIIQDMLGHERLETTRIYTHMGVEQAKEYIKKAFEDDFK